jgi:organic radical activating enzyme
MTTEIKIKQFKKGTEILRAGEVSKYCFKVLKGCLKSFTIDKSGKENIIQFAPEDWWISDLDSFINEKPSELYILALEDTEVAYITKVDFDNFKNFSLTEILQKVIEFSKNSQGKIVRKLVVITGGEPMRQPIEKICKELILLKFLVQIETNGTIFRELPSEVKIICSPKISNHKYHILRPDILQKIDALKFIISANNEDYSDVGEVGQSSHEDISIYVQPMDEYDDKKNKENLQKCLDLCEENGYFLSLQTHKIVGLK